MGSNSDMSEDEDLPFLAESTMVCERTKEGPKIQMGIINHMTCYDKVQHFEQFGRKNIVNLWTEEKKYCLTIKSRSRDVETEIRYNIILPDEDSAPDTNTLRPGATAESFLVQDHIEMRIGVENNDTRHRLRTDEETLSQTRSCISSLFRGVKMTVPWLREGSIIIGLQPTTQRAVLTLMEAMEEGFLETLVQNILENQIASDTDCRFLQVNEPIKMKIEVNIPKAMFPKNFSCRQYSSMTEIIEELKITIRQQEKFEEERKEADRKTIKLAKLVIKRSQEETRKREETVDVVRHVAGKTETLGAKLNIAFGVSGVMFFASIFTFGATAAASTAGCAALVAAFIVAIKEIVAEIEVQRKLTEYDLLLEELFDALSLLLKTEDKESVRRSLNEALKDQPIDAKNQTLKILLEDLNAVRLGKIFTVDLDEEEVRLKDFDLVKYIKKLLKKFVAPFIIVRDLRKVADDLDQYQVLVR